jgi:hypothetical protein
MGRNVYGRVWALVPALVVAGILGTASGSRAADGCADGSSLGIREATAVIGRLSAPAGKQTLRLSGLFVIASDPPIDPAASGVRVTVEHDPSPLVDVTIPGGAHWRRRQARWEYRDPAGSAGGIVRVALKQVPVPLWATYPAHTSSNAAFSLTIEGKRLALSFPPQTVPFVGLTVNADAYQCGQTLFFSDQALRPGCASSKGTLRCVSGGPPSGPCRVSSPEDLVICDALNAANAEQTDFEKRGTFFIGQCADLAGFSSSPGVSCVVGGLQTGFAVTTTHPAMFFTSGCTWMSDPTPPLRNLHCS